MMSLPRRGGALLWSSLLFHHSSSVAALKPKSEYLVKNLEQVEPAFAEFDGDMYAGLIPIHASDDAVRQGEIMFWLFAPRQPSAHNTLTMWLNGGPGCSSFQCGNLFETGPVTVPLRPAGWCCSREDDPLQVNGNAWTQATYMLFVEQPVGVGFSWGPWPETEDDVADDMVGWLHNFFDIFDDLKGYDYHIFGESYAGMYVPAIARGIYHDNLKSDKERNGDPINLKGIAIGNGWMDVKLQGSAAIDYAWWHGMIDKRQRDAFLDEWETCLQDSPLDSHFLKKGDHHTFLEPYHSFTTPDECGLAEAILEAAGNDLWPGQAQPNQYDVTTWDTYPVIQLGNTTILNFYNNPKVQKALNAPPEQWMGCLPGEGRRRRLLHLGRSRRRGLQDEDNDGLMLDQDRPLSMLSYLAELLDEAQIRVLIYNADLDLSVNAQGADVALNAMQWSGAEAWAVQSRGVWTTPYQADKVAGYAKRVDGLTFLVVRNSGHLVPYNQPKNALDMLKRHLGDESFVDETVPFLKTDPLTQSTPREATDASSRGHGILINALFLAVGLVMGVFVSRQSRREGYKPVNGQRHL